MIQNNDCQPMRKHCLNKRYFYLPLLLILNALCVFGQDCPTDKGYKSEYFSLESQLGNLKEYLEVGYCKQTTANQKEQEIFGIIKKKKPILNENVMVSFEITFKTKSKKEVIMKGTPEFKKDQFIRQGWGHDANQDLQLIIDENFCFPCDTIDIESAKLDDVSITYYSGALKDSVLKRAKPAAPIVKTDSADTKLGGNNRFSAPPQPTSPKLPFDTAEYRQKVNDKIQDFQENIRNLSNTKSRLLVDNTIKQTLKLFIREGEDVTVQISSKNNKTARSLPVAQYLNNLTRLKYQRVEIIWTKVFIADNFYKGQDGNYYATVTFDQIFRGINDNVVAYADITRKKIEIQLKTYMKDDKLSWDVFLGSTEVQETKDF
jgi:hypothetical protein